MKICKMAMTAILDKLKKFYNFWAVQPPIVTISDTEEASNVLFYTFGNYDILT